MFRPATKSTAIKPTKPVFPVGEIAEAPPRKVRTPVVQPIRQAREMQEISGLPRGRPPSKSRRQDPELPKQVQNSHLSYGAFFGRIGPNRGRIPREPRNCLSRWLPIGASDQAPLFAERSCQKRFAKNNRRPFGYKSRE